ASAGPRFRPYASQKHQVTKGRYITSNDPRGYIPVYEYPLNGQWIMMDIDDGYILWTGIWKALGNSKADIVKMIDSQPDLASVIRRVRGGYLKIQGTWMPYEVALRLSRRVAWLIRDDLIPLFGPTFPSTCLTPDQTGYGQIVSTATGRRRPRRNNQLPTPASSNGPQSSLSSWPSSIPLMPGPSSFRDLNSTSFHSPSDLDAPPSRTDGYAYPPHRLPQHSDSHRSIRYSPYPVSTVGTARKSSISTSDSVSIDFPSIALHDHPSDLYGASSKLPGDQIKLPPIQPLAPPLSISNPSYALPPISALEDLRGVSSQDSAAVLQRLKMDDDRRSDVGAENIHWSRQRSMS
ncbi:transcription regulator HTH, apses-type DNA-binding domain-containing protein, partial [Scleroderma citrinum]